MSHRTLSSRRPGASAMLRRDRMYLFGFYDGRNGGYYNDMFCYDFGMRIYAAKLRVIVILFLITKNWNELKVPEECLSPRTYRS